MITEAACNKCGPKYFSSFSLLVSVLLLVTHGFLEESPHLSLLLQVYVANLDVKGEEKEGLERGEQDQKTAGYMNAK